MPPISSGGSFDPSRLPGFGNTPSSSPELPRTVEGPKPQDVQFFNQSFQNDPALQPPQGVLPALDQLKGPTSSAAPSSSFSETIANKIEGAQKNYQGLLSNINHGLSQTPLGMRDIMQLQFNFGQLSLQQEVWGKIASKGVQAIQKLFSGGQG